MVDLANQPWENVIDPKKTVSEQAKEFDKIVSDTLERHAPLIKSKIHEQFKKGLSEDTKRLIREREKWRRKLVKCKDPTRINFLGSKYRKIRNAVTSRIRKEAKRAVLDSIKESGNASEYWKAVSPITKNKVNEILCLIEN